MALLNRYLRRKLARLLIWIAAAVTALVQKAAVEAGRARLVSVVIGRPMSLHDHRGQKVHHARATAVVADA